MTPMTYAERQSARAAEPEITMNRAGRRALGFRGPMWVRDTQASVFFVPRFVRRHGTEKKHWAKVARLMAGRMTA